MKSLREYIQEAAQNKLAIGHFNISNLEGFHAVCNVAKKLGVPVIIGLSEGEESFVGAHEAHALVAQMREEEHVPVFLNADHHYSFESVKKSIDAGFDAAIIDMAAKSLEENITVTKQCVQYARELSRATGRDILIEGELGYIGSGSSIKESIPEGAVFTISVSDAEKYVKETGVDLFAPAVGNVHGLIKTGKPHINPELVRSIKESVQIPLVLHGGSGLSNDDFKNGIANGIAIVHINTELRVAYAEALKAFITEHNDETTPYKIMTPVVSAMEKIVEEKIRLFNNLR